MKHGEIVVYKTTHDAGLQLEVKIEDETVWLTQAQIVDLFETSKANVSEHIKHIYQTGELDRKSTVRKIRTVQVEGRRQVARNIEYYNLDIIISIGYRVNSIRGTQFRIWANKILKDYLLKGYAFNQRLEKVEKKVLEHDQAFDLLIKTSLPPTEGIFYDGQIFDAWEFVSGLIKEAKDSIVLIDNYIDESVLGLLAKRAPQVKATIYTAKTDQRLKLDLKRHNKQYPPVQIRTFSRAHDRFLIIDEETVYHIGASLKDLGKKWFAFSRMQLNAKDIIERLKQ